VPPGRAYIIIGIQNSVIDENCEIFFDETSHFCELPLLIKIKVLKRIS